MKKIELLLYQWMENERNHKYVSNNLLKRGILDIGIFGAGLFGDALYKDVINSNIRVHCFIDKLFKCYQGKLYSVPVIPIDKIIDLDKNVVIIITSLLAQYYIRDEIIKNDKNRKILFLEELIQEDAKDYSVDYI